MASGIVIIGECMLELSGTDSGPLRLGCAGDTFNTCIYLVRLGLKASYLTALGADPFSKEMLSGWLEEGVDSSHVLIDPERLPGLYAIRTNSCGERSFYYWRESSAARHLFDLPGIDGALEAARRASLIYLSGITLSLFENRERERLRDTCAAVRENGGQVAFDSNFRRNGWSSAAEAARAIDAIAPLVTLAMPTFEDERELYGDETPEHTAERWHRSGASDSVVKLGPQGCLVSTPECFAIVDAEAGVIPVDTTGAGDAFNAGYIAARHFGLTAPDAGAYANRLAAEVVKHPGAIIDRGLIPGTSLATVPPRHTSPDLVGEA